MSRLRVQTVIALALLLARRSAQPGRPADWSPAPYPSWHEHPGGRECGAAASDGQRIYLMGGSVPDHHGSADAEAAVFSPDRGWRLIHPLGIARRLCAAVALPDGRVAVIAGSGPAGSSLGSIEIYEPERDAWTLASFTLLEGRAGPAAVSVPGRGIYVFGGLDSRDGVLSSAERVELEPGHSIRIAPMPHRRRDAAAVLGPGGRIYLIGGRNEEGPILAVDIYDPARNGWTTAAPMPRAQTAAGVTRGPDGRIYVIGGWPGLDGTEETNAVEAYDPASDTWAAAAPMTTARASLAAATLGAYLYVFGGYQHTSTLDLPATGERYGPVALARR